MLESDSVFDTLVSLLGETIYAIIAVAILIAVISAASRSRIIDAFPALEMFTSPIVVMTPPPPPFPPRDEPRPLKADLSVGLQSVLDDCASALFRGNDSCKVGNVSYKALFVVAYFAIYVLLFFVYAGYLFRFVVPVLYSVMNAGVSLLTVASWHDLAAAANKQFGPSSYLVSFENEMLLFAVAIASLLLVIFKLTYTGRRPNLPGANEDAPPDDNARVSEAAK
jgi:hypothetical protein